MSVSAALLDLLLLIWIYLGLGRLVGSGLYIKRMSDS